MLHAIVVEESEDNPMEIEDMHSSSPCSSPGPAERNEVVSDTSELETTQTTEANETDSEQPNKNKRAFVPRKKRIQKLTFSVSI